MEIFFNTHTLLIPGWIVIMLGTFSSFLITYISIPTIITVSHKLHLYERTNGRQSHKGEVPTLGGVAIFAGLVVAGAIFSDISLIHEFQYVLGALVILFFIGIKDDLLIMDPRKELLAQIVAAGIVVVLGDVRITDFHGFANIHEIPYIISLVFSIFVYIVIINGFNLIDGIDGLSSGVAIVTSLAFGIWFIIRGDTNFALVPFGLVGSLIAFFRFNVFGKRNRIFLGDTGSLSIGFILAVIAIQFLEYKDPITNEHTMLSAPAVAFGILIVPLFDTIRVFTIRIFVGDPPFKGDKKHIHHRLLDLGCRHFKASLIIITINLFIIGLVFLLRDIGNLKLLIIVMFLASFFSYIPIYLINKRKTADNN